MPTQFDIAYEQDDRKVWGWAATHRQLDCVESLSHAALHLRVMASDGEPDRRAFYEAKRQQILPLLEELRKQMEECQLWKYQED